MGHVAHMQENKIERKIIMGIQVGNRKEADLRRDGGRSEEAGCHKFENSSIGWGPIVLGKRLRLHKAKEEDVIV